MNPTETIRAYHQRTKHQRSGYARGPEYLDWEQQPDPFRRFTSARLLPLPFTPDPKGEAVALRQASIAKLLELSMGLSAWKAFGPDRWALRCNPSSGNLHPTEAYVVCRNLTGLDDGVYHYAPHEHALEHRAGLADHDANGYCLIGLTSIAWREAWKYGERAYRYCQLDVGHALGALRYAAATLGWQIRLLPLDDQSIDQLLGLDRADDFRNAEPEWPDVMVQILAPQSSPIGQVPVATRWQGQANALGGDPYLKWPVINQAHHACLNQDPQTFDLPAPPEPTDLTPEATVQLTRLIRQRRSGQGFIGKQSTLPLAAFEAFAGTLAPQPGTRPWDFWGAPPRLHLILFIHRVEGLSPGLYALPRHPDVLGQWQRAFSGDFEWQTTPITRQALPLYRLQGGDMRKSARSLSCHQEIAAASSFSFAMLAQFDHALDQHPAHYRALHWEAGLIGQTAYLEAERMGMRGTGIGCFFDDAVHALLGIQDTQWQTLYHFTVGSPRIDDRLQTLPPYDHLNREKIDV